MARTAVAAFFGAVVAAASGASPSPQYDVTFLSATPFDGSHYADGMPAGNGATVVLAWGNATSGGLDFFLRSPLAMHMDSTLFTIAKVSVTLSPNPFVNASAYYNQTHHLADGSITVLGGGTSLADYAAGVSLYVDANAQVVMVSAGARDGVTPYGLSVSMQSVRPANSTLEFQDIFHCWGSSSRPDVVADGALPPPAPSNALALYHVNSAAAGDPSFFNQTLDLQGLASLAGTFPDPLDGRVFGAAVTGAARADGSGAPLLRAGPGQLTSAAPAAAFLVRVDVLVLPDARADEALFRSALAAAVAAGPAPAVRATASAAWWSGFWARSYIDTPATPPPPPPPSAPRVGAFPCGGALAPSQVVLLDAASGDLTLPGGLCFVPVPGGLEAGNCSEAGGAWRLTPCTTPGCGPGDTYVAQVPAASLSSSGVSDLPAAVFDMLGATCPWVDTYAAVTPQGQFKNEIFYWNASDATLRTAVKRDCTGACITVVAPAPPPPPGSASPLSAQYARTRFIQAAQSRGHAVPLKFNGMLFLAQAGDSGPHDVDSRQWGADHWWQNTRLPYWSMFAAGDFDGVRVVLDWLAGAIPLALARTAALLPGEAGIFFTEVSDIFGLYQSSLYGCDAASRPPGYPVWLEGAGSTGGWTRFDFGGNGHGPQAGLMALDYYWHTLDAEAAARYVPLATHTLDFYMSHYPNRTADGKLLIWPTQVLEMYWCEWPGNVNCCENDLPQVAAVTALARGLLQLPEESGLLTPAQRAAYAAFAALLPPLPVSADGTAYAPAAVVSSGTHNSEIPELYGVHPFRLLTAGRAAVDPAVNLTLGVNSWQTLPLAKSNSGWYYGGIDAALLGLANESYAMVLDRASQPPPPGYRYPAFAQHYQDYPPSADHYANMNTALQFMLLQPGEDGPAGSIVLLPAWPCGLDVAFKLAAPLNTTVEVVYANATLVSIDVQPPSRAGAVKWAACVPAGD